MSAKKKGLTAVAAPQETGTEAHGSEEQGTYHELKAKAASELFKLWQQQRVNLDLALEAAQTLSLTDQALVAQVEDPEGYLRSQILSVKRAAAKSLTTESPVAGWHVRMEYADEIDSGVFEYDDYAEATEFFHDEITAVSARAAFLYEVREDGTSREIQRIAVEPHSSAGAGGSTPVEGAYLGLSWHAADRLTLHPIAEAYPVMSEVEFGALVEDIRANGQREPVWVDGQHRIVDGRHRWMVCRELGSLVKVGYCSDLGLTSESELQAFATSQNLHRRHLNESQRAMAAALCAGITNGGKTPPAPPQAGGDKGTANLQSPRVTVAEAAARHKVSPRSVATAKKVLEKGTPEVIAAVQAGTVSVSAAAKGLATVAAPQATGTEKHGTKGNGKKKAKHSTGEEQIRDLKTEERDCLAQHDYLDVTADCIPLPGGHHAFVRRIDKKTRVDIDFMNVDGFGDRWVASIAKKDGGRTIGFYLSVEDGIAAIDHYLATGECLPDSKKVPGSVAAPLAIEPHSSEVALLEALGFVRDADERVLCWHHKARKIDAVFEEDWEIISRERVDSSGLGTSWSHGGGLVGLLQDESFFGAAVDFPPYIPGVTEGSPFETPSDVNQEGFRFDVLCQGVELLRRLGPASALEYATPSQDQVDYLAEFLERTAGGLGEIAAAFATQLVEEG